MLLRFLEETCACEKLRTVCEQGGGVGRSYSRRPDRNNHTVHTTSPQRLSTLYSITSAHRQLVLTHRFYHTRLNILAAGYKFGFTVKNEHRSRTSRAYIAVRDYLNMPARESESEFITTDDWHAEYFLRPSSSAAQRKMQVITIPLGSLQRLIAIRAVSISAIPTILQTMNDCVSQGVDIQLKILQIVLSLITNFLTIHGRLLENVRAFVLCSIFSSLTNGPTTIRCEIGPPLFFKLHGSRTAVVSSTAGTPRQLVVSVVDRVLEKDRRMLLPNKPESITLPDGTTQALRSRCARRLCYLREPLCVG